MGRKEVGGGAGETMAQSDGMHSDGASLITEKSLHSVVFGLQTGRWLENPAQSRTSE